jgi:uncharacterized protein YcnI
MKTIPYTVAFLMLAAIAFAHVRVKPNQSQPGINENYLLRVPSEGGRTTTSVTLEVPVGVTIISASAPDAVPTAKVDRKMSGKNIVEITWTLEIKPDSPVELPFVAKNPSAVETIMWKVTQRYSDGTKVAWAGPKGDKTPAAVTTLAVAPAK